MLQLGPRLRLSESWRKSIRAQRQTDAGAGTVDGDEAMNDCIATLSGYIIKWSWPYTYAQESKIGPRLARVQRSCFLVTLRKAYVVNFTNVNHHKEHHRLW